MVSNWLPSINRIRWGNSSVITPWGLSRVFMPETKLRRSGTCASTLFPTIRSAWLPPRTISSANSWPKKSHQGGNAFLGGFAGNVHGQLDAQHRNTLLHEILEQVAVIARQFHHEAVRAQLKPFGHQLGIGLGMGQPAVGVGRKISVLAEDMFRTDVFLQL